MSDFSTSYGISILLILLVPFLGLFGLDGTMTSHRQDTDGILLLNALEKDILRAFGEMERSLDAAASMILEKGPSEPVIRSQLQRLVRSFPLIMDVSWISLDGVMVYVEPEAYQSYEGADISDQEQIIRLHQTLAPTLSRLFLSVEGFTAMDFEWPVILGDELLGSISLLIRPETFWNQVLISKAFKNPTDNIWIMDDQGYAVYHNITERLFQNPLDQPWPELVELTRKILDEPLGVREYQYIQGEPRKAYWKQIDLFETRFKLVYTHPLP